jgi:hypothetical protein
MDRQRGWTTGQLDAGERHSLSLLSAPLCLRAPVHRLDDDVLYPCAARRLPRHPALAQSAEPSTSIVAHHKTASAA